MRIIIGTLILLLSPLGALLAADDAPKITLTPGFKAQVVFENDETSGKNSTFKIKRARATLDGDLDKRLTAHLTIETIDDDEGVILIQGYATYKLHRALRLQAGQMYVPFGLENRTGFDKRKFYERSLVTDALGREMGRRPDGERSARFRDIGLMALGTASIDSGFDLNYMAMIFNGNGILTSDNNEHKDLAGRVQLTTPPGLAIGASAYYGKFRETDDSLDYDETAFGVDLAWNGRLADRVCQLQAEYAAGTWEDSDADIKPAGFYLYGTIYALPKLETGVRYDRLEPNRNAETEAIGTRVTLVARYYLGNGSFLATDYEIRDYDGRDTDNRLTIQVMALF